MDEFPNFLENISTEFSQKSNKRLVYIFYTVKQQKQGEAFTLFFIFSVLSVNHESQIRVSLPDLILKPSCYNTHILRYGSQEKCKNLFKIPYQLSQAGRG